MLLGLAATTGWASYAGGKVPLRRAVATAARMLLSSCTSFASASCGGVTVKFIGTLDAELVEVTGKVPGGRVGPKGQLRYRASDAGQATPPRQDAACLCRNVARVSQLDQVLEEVLGGLFLGRHI
eukprot:15471840-Alexandrium_andersonii.AAC.1